MNKLSHRQVREHKRIKKTKHIARMCHGLSQLQCMLLKVRNR